MATKSILFLSNGFAEDTVGANLLAELRQLDPSLKFYALPIVGLGTSYEQAGATVIGPRWELPSQGITYGPEFDLGREIKAGAIQLYLGKIWALIKNRRKFDLVICTGDYLSTMISGMFVKKPLVYLWVTLSHFDGVIKHFLKKYSIMVFSRWRSWTHLPEFKVEFVGNPYMDNLKISNESLGLDKSVPTVAVLPGSREPAYNNLPKIIETMELILKKRKVNFVFALSPKTDKERFAKVPQAVITDKLGDVLNAANIVLGLAGTANEQAAGLGKPIVAFWGGGHSREERIVKSHANRFLKEAAVVLPPEPEKVSAAILSLLADSAKMKSMGEQGIEQNGGRGGTRVIAERIHKWLKKN